MTQRMRLEQLLRRGRDDSGQAGIMMVLAMMVLAVPMMLAVFDGGLLLNDRRDAQALVDRAAMAGALDLMLAPSDTGSQAEDIAREWVIRNGGDPATDTITVSATNTCYSGNDPFPTGVTVTIERDPPVFLAGALGLDLRSGATATACAGVPIEHFGIFPLVVSSQGLIGTCFDNTIQPIPGADCQIRVDSSSGGLVGELSVEFPNGEDEVVNCTDSGSGANDLNNNLIHGIQAWCAAGQAVSAKPGQNIGQTFNGIKGRLALEGSCDAAYASAGGTTSALQQAWSELNAYLAAYPGYDHEGLRTSDSQGAMPAAGDGVDDFYEVWSYGSGSGPASDLTPLHCPGYGGETNSPRNVVLIVVHDTFETQNNTYVIRDFVRLYIEGCTRTTNSGVSEFRRDCGWNSLGNGKLTIHGRFVHQVGSPAANVGLTELMLGDQEVFLLR